MKAGVSIDKTYIFQEIFEERSFRLTNCDHLHLKIPFVHRQEQKNIRNKISGMEVSAIFDGTTHTCETRVILLQL